MVGQRVPVTMVRARGIAAISLPQLRRQLPLPLQRPLLLARRVLHVQLQGAAQVAETVRNAASNRNSSETVAVVIKSFQ